MNTSKKLSTAYIIWALAGLIGGHELYLNKPMHFGLRTLVFCLVGFLFLLEIIFFSDFVYGNGQSLSALTIAATILLLLLGAKTTLDLFFIPKWFREL